MLQSQVYREKAHQVGTILTEYGIDLWLLLGRETADVCDPNLRLVLPINVMGTSAFLYSRSGERIAIVRAADVEGVEQTGLFTKVIGYPLDFNATLRGEVQRLNPNRIALNYDLDDPLLDGLTLGMYRRLEQSLAGTPYLDRLTDSEVAFAVRGRKTASELALMQSHLGFLHQACRKLGPHLKPGVTERLVYDRCRSEMAASGYTGSWDEHCCPLVHAGPKSLHGMVTPGENPIVAGDVFHLSWGVKRDGYAVDFQRSWYIPSGDAPEPPVDIRGAFDTIIYAVEETRKAMVPGRQGWEVDQVARQILAEAGHTEYPRGTGHAVGRALHDGGVALAPKGPRYGRMAERPLEIGQVFTLELFLPTSGGVAAKEEMVQVTEGGGRFLAPPQTELWIAGPT